MEVFRAIDVDNFRTEDVIPTEKAQDWVAVVKGTRKKPSTEVANVLISYQHYPRANGYWRTEASKLLSLEDVKKLSEVAGVAGVRLYSDKVIPCDRTKDWKSPVKNFYRDLDILCVTNREISFESICKFWFLVELVMSNNAGCTIISSRKMKPVIINILSSVHSLDDVVSRMSEGLVVDNTGAIDVVDTIYNDRSRPGLDLTRLSPFRSDGREDCDYLDLLRNSEAVSTRIIDNAAEGETERFLGVRSALFNRDALKRRQIVRELGTDNTYVLAPKELTEQLFENTRILVSIPRGIIDDREMLKFGRDAGLDDRFVQRDLVAEVKKIPPCLLGEIACATLLSGSPEGLLWMSRVTYNGADAIRLEVAYAAGRSLETEYGNAELRIGGMNAPRSERKYVPCSGLNLIDAVSLMKLPQRMGSKRMRTYFDFLKAGVEEDGISFRSLRKYGSKVITSLYNEGRLPLLIATELAAQHLHRFDEEDRERPDYVFLADAGDYVLARPCTMVGIVLSVILQMLVIALGGMVLHLANPDAWEITRSAEALLATWLIANTLLCAAGEEWESYRSVIDMLLFRVRVRKRHMSSPVVTVPRQKIAQLDIRSTLAKGYDCLEPGGSGNLRLDRKLDIDALRQWGLKTYICDKGKEYFEWREKWGQLEVKEPGTYHCVYPAEHEEKPRLHPKPLTGRLGGGQSSNDS